MTECRVTLLTDGSSDRTLIPPVTWLLHEKLPGIPLQLEWADLSRVPRPAKGLSGKIRAAIEYYPCDVLLVHRDAEREAREKRVEEIQSACTGIPFDMPHVCVVTVRMQEAWMLIDEIAIRGAAGNPNGGVPLEIPRLQDLENLPDPKTVLYELLRRASELTGRRLKKFSVDVHRVAELIDDWRPLRRLSAFVAFENELDEILTEFRLQENGE